MGRVLGIGLTDYPFMEMSDLTMSRSLQMTVMSERIDDSKRSPSNWPLPMQHAWGDDMGKRAGKLAREHAVQQFRKIYTALEEFDPDVTILLAKDHFEAFDRSIYLPYWISAFDSVSIKPYREENIFGEPANTEVRIAGARDFGIRLANGLQKDGIYAPLLTEPKSPEGLAHTYRSALVHIDWDNRAFSRRILPFPINPFGSRLRGYDGLSPESPDDWRPISMDAAFQIGESIARVVRSGDERVAIVVGAGWSHANNTAWDRSWLWPDVEADQQLFDIWSSGNIEHLRGITPNELEEHGWWELLLWAVLAGAMCESGSVIEQADFQPGWIFNSNWVTTIFSAGA